MEVDVGVRLAVWVRRCMGHSRNAGRTGVGAPVGETRSDDRVRGEIHVGVLADGVMGYASITVGTSFRAAVIVADAEHSTKGLGWDVMGGAGTLGIGVRV